MKRVYTNPTMKITSYEAASSVMVNTLSSAQTSYKSYTKSSINF